MQNTVKYLKKREFSLYGELLVAKKLEELGWEVFRPLVDRYIDLIAVKEIENKIDIRTIQVKSSRIEHFICLVTLEDGEQKILEVESIDFENKKLITKDKKEMNFSKINVLAESYGFTHKPKDLLHDPRHFFVWVLIDQFKNNPHFFILSVKDFIRIRWRDKPSKKYSNILKRKDKRWSLLMRDEWRWDTDRMHPLHHIEKKSSRYKSFIRKIKNLQSVLSNLSVSINLENEPEWELDGVPLDPFLDNWKALDKIDKTSNAEMVINSQEINDEWIGNTTEIIEKWKKQKDKLREIIEKKNPDLLGHIARLDELLIYEEEG